MKERLSDSEKDKLKDKLKQSWKDSSYLLDKLSSEIAFNFWNKKNPWIYKESIKNLLKLKENINSKNNIFNLKEELKNLSSHLSEENKKAYKNSFNIKKEELINI